MLVPPKSLLLKEETLGTCIATTATIKSPLMMYPNRYQSTIHSMYLIKPTLFIYDFMCLKENVVVKK